MLDKGSVMWVLMYFIGVSLYVVLLFKVMTKITTKYMPYLMKFIKKGFAKEEKVRIMGFRGLLKVYFRGNTILGMTALFLLVMMYNIMETGLTVQYLIGWTLTYVALFVLYAILILLYECWIAVKDD